MTQHVVLIQLGLCIGFAFVGAPLAGAQGLAPATLGEVSKATEATPTTNPKKSKSKGSIEISAGEPNEEATPVVEQTTPSEELATPAPTPERREPRVRNRAIVRPTSPGALPAAPTSLAAAKGVAISAPLPDYPYEARRAHIRGSGVCVMTVDMTSGKVTTATMAQSTGSALLDKITTDTFQQWRFKPGTVAQVRVPITYR